MRLDRIDLLRYGHFANRSVDLPVTTPDYYVIYGDNEAGKSTLLRGISSLFFGVPARTVDVHSCKTSELRIGATISDGEKTFSFRRRKGTSGTLLNLDDGQVPESLVTGFLRELDRERFEQFFGLTHQRLREGGEELLRGKGDIGSALFQAAGLLDLRTLLERLDAETKELFSPKSRTKVINCAIEDYKTAKAEVRRLAISGSAIKQKQADLEGAKETHERLKTESESLLHELVRLRRIASNKPDVARLQELRGALLTFEQVPSLPVSARRERDESVSVFTEATGQIQVLAEHVSQRKDRIGALHVNNILKNHAKEIEDLNSETNDYHRSVSDKPKRVNERTEAMQRAEAEWRGIWRDRPITNAEKVRTVYSRKSEIFALVTEHARLATALAQADELVRTAREDEDRLREDLERCPDLGEPLSPVEMKEWMQARQTILDRLEQCHEKEEDLQLRMDRAARAADQIRRCLAQFQAVPVRENDSLTILLRVAEGLAKDLQERRRVIEDIRRQLHQLSPEKRQAKQAECKTRLDGWAQRWSAVVSELLLPEGRTPEQVGDAIAVLERVFGHLKDAENLQHRVNRIGENIDLFEKRVAVLVAATDPSLASSAADVAVTELQSRLVKTGKAETERKTLEEQNARDEDVIAGHAIKVQRAEANLKRLMDFAHSISDQELEATIAASEQKAEKRDEYERIAQGLIERNAAPDVREIEEEASGHHLDSLQSAIATSENRQRDLQDEVFRTGSAYGTLLQEFERLQASDESTMQAQKAEDALGRVRPALAHYLRLQLASEVLQRAIESYREKHQGPVLNRASDLFSSLTLGDYSGLTTGFGDNDKSVLVAIRRNKENVEIDGLSDGTRDQLYLALRLAAIEHHVETVSACPVILDDILINADNARASATLRVLGDLARRTQVLFFTHHKHLEDLGRNAGAQIIDLSGSSVATHA